MMLTTTFERLHDAGACIERYRYLARKLGGVRKYGRRTPITLLQILDINGLDDCLWAMPTVEQKDEIERVSRLFVCWCARNTPLPDGRRLWDLLTDERSRTAVETAERYAAGLATDDELAAAGDAAWAAAGAARAAAWAASTAAGDAASAAAWAAAWAASTAAWAASAAAGDAARAAAWAASVAAWAAAGDAAEDAARDAQEEFLRDLLEC